MSKKFIGTGVAVITPFHKDGSIDFRSFEKVINHLISNGINYIVTLGTTGESTSLNIDEKNAVINFVVEITDGRIPVVVGLGGNNTADVVNNLKQISLDGADAVLSVCPYYIKPQQGGIYLHYKAVANNSPVPVILYNVPDRTGVNIKAETTLQLANDFDNIIGIKEASKNFEQCVSIIKNKPENFILISGDDNSTLPLMAFGASGVISVTANAFPKEFSEMVHLCKKGDYKSARKIHFQLTDFTSSLFMEGSPCGIKAAMEIMGLCQNYLRLPNVPVSRTTYNVIKNAINGVIAISAV